MQCKQLNVILTSHTACMHRIWMLYEKNTMEYAVTSMMMMMGWFSSRLIRERFQANDYYGNEMIWALCTDFTSVEVFFSSSYFFFDARFIETKAAHVWQAMNWWSFTNISCVCCWQMLTWMFIRDKIMKHCNSIVLLQDIFKFISMKQKIWSKISFLKRALHFWRFCVKRCRKNIWIIS